ncbi:MAG TPA: outer-membrane lipoprotein carrier protein LolA [Longimicrobiaceae bacterium]|nr:outer-membrane lipoprotein carrier protein LolA [Longimicrobiaceae bacterium]
MKRLVEARVSLLTVLLAAAACGRPDTGVQKEASAAGPARASAPAVAPGESREMAPETAPAEGVAAPASPGGDSESLAPGTRGAPTPASGGAGTPTPVEPDGARQLPAAPDAARAESDAGAEQVLRQVERSYAAVRSMQADFVQDLRVPLLGTSQRSSGKIYQRRPDRFLMRFSDPAGDVIVADGRYFWMYYPSSDPRQVMKTSIAAGSEQVDLHRQFLSDPVGRYDAALGGEEMVDGHRTRVLTLVPKQQSPYRQLRIWVDADDYAVRRFEMTEENESVRRIEFRNLRRNVPLPDALFAFTPPRGTQVFEQ